MNFSSKNKTNWQSFPMKSIHFRVISKYVLDGHVILQDRFGDFFFFLGGGANWADQGSFFSFENAVNFIQDDFLCNF